MFSPKPISTKEIELTHDLLMLTEMLAENTHNIWAQSRIMQGWTYGPTRDDQKKQTPCLVPYNDLPEVEKEYDRKTATETIKLITKLGYSISKVR
ncbi:MAG: RyR domain-containing protein [Evtepia sp.]|uniref:RyR domain-containing protein n=1 Tax=Evtepia sp. TaxID=2773933 RepID=UPI002A752DC8|nr:RyR domain-containing protein [Evtepia sp.]MDY3014852.1 RyR domain-containing protein [Evtepia sp.]